MHSAVTLFCFGATPGDAQALENIEDKKENREARSLASVSSGFGGEGTGDLGVGSTTTFFHDAHLEVLNAGEGRGGTLGFVLNFESS